MWITFELYACRKYRNKKDGVEKGMENLLLETDAGEKRGKERKRREGKEGKEKKTKKGQQSKVGTRKKGIE